jgi:hypothetical protein
VLGQVDDRVVAAQPDIERKVRLEPVLELDGETEPRPPGHRGSGVTDTQHRGRVGAHQRTRTAATQARLR